MKLLEPRRPFLLVETKEQLQRAIEALRESAELAVDAERASGFRYGSSAYLIQFATTEEIFQDVLSILGLKESGASEFSTSLKRTSSFLQHPVFNTYFSETSMLRYLRTLADRDLALDRDRKSVV